MRYFAGLSLGQMNDHVALAVCEKLLEGDTPLCLIRGLKRWEAGASYPVICEDVRELLRGFDAPLVVDITMVGLPIGKLFEKVLKRVYFATITGGDSEIKDENTPRAYRVPKRILVSTVQMLLQTQRLKVAPGMAETPALLSALSNFQLTKSEAIADSQSILWREQNQDDLVFAVAVSCWAALSGHFTPQSFAVGRFHAGLLNFKVR
jgi:hypothetical protein